MRRAGSTAVPALLAALALVAGVLGPCVCLPEATPTAEHACCAPPSGYRPAEGSCCPEPGSTAAAAIVVPSPSYAVADLVPVAAVTAPHAARAVAAPLSAPTPTLSPPLTARRV
jgi:hypothetical protein